MNASHVTSSKENGGNIINSVKNSNKCNYVVKLFAQYFWQSRTRGMLCTQKMKNWALHKISTCDREGCLGSNPV